MTGTETPPKAVESRTATATAFQGKTNLPSDWPLVPLGTLCSFGNGVNADKSAYGKGIPFINVLDVITHTHLRARHVPGRVRLPKSVLEAFTVRRDDILFNRTSETQTEVGLAAVYNDDEPVVFGGFVIRGRFTSATLNPDYAGYALRAPTVRSQIVAQGQGAIRANIGQENLRRVLVPIPSQSEQRAIARVLSDVDELIGSLEALIAKKRAIKRAAMQELLTGRTRLPGFSQPWESKRLADAAKISMGRTPSRNNATYWGGNHIWLCVADLKGKVVTESKERITNAAAAQMQAVPAGTLLMSFKLSIGRVGFAGADLYTNEAICGFQHLTLDADYLYYALQRINYSKYGRQAVKGYTLNSESLGRIEVPLPPSPEQRAIAGVFSDMDDEIAALERRLDKTRAIKQGMMQELLTGRTRLPIPAEPPAKSEARHA